ncbi:extracellular solute-binding protein [Halobacteriaceae archaeon GCM10025711]
MSDDALSRRAVLGGTAAVLGSLAGCAGSAREAVSVLAAGSLQNALMRSLAETVEPTLQVEAFGSAHAAHLVADGQRDPDVLALADPALFEGDVDAPWYALFASNAVGIAYNPDTERGRAVGDADTWYRPLLDVGVRVGRTDPDLDPLGYRTRFALELAADHYDRPDLASTVLGNADVYPETELLAQFESGQVDAAFVYRNMAVERDYPFVELPARVDLSDPAHAAFYRTVSYTLPTGTTVTGDVIQYGATLRRDRTATRAVFRTMVESTDDYLPGHGFTVPENYPTYHGDVPDALRD